MNDLRAHILQKSVRIRFNSEPTRFYRELKTIGNFYVYKMGNPNTCGLHMKPKENFKIGNSIYTNSEYLKFL